LHRSALPSFAVSKLALRFGAMRQRDPPGSHRPFSCKPSHPIKQGETSMNKYICAIAACIALALPAMHVSARPSQWHFKVSNSTSTRIVKLQVSENKKDWGDFDIGKGIAADETATLIWDSSTDNEACEQWIRAKFSDGVYSKPSKQDFCNDLDEPIEFTEDD
jgi:hypothetical protein